MCARNWLPCIILNNIRSTSESGQNDIATPGYRPFGVSRETPPHLNGAHHTDAYRIHVGGRESLEILYNILGMELLDPRDTKVNAWIENGFLHTPIRSRRTVEYSGEVLNFEVEGQHSYTTDAFTVHNCGDLMWIYIKVKDDVLTEVKFKNVRVRSGYSH